MVYLFVILSLIKKPKCLIDASFGLFIELIFDQSDSIVVVELSLNLDIWSLL